MVVPAVDVMIYGERRSPATVMVTIFEPAQAGENDHRWADARLLPSETEPFCDALTEALRLLEGEVRP